MFHKNNWLEPLYKEDVISVIVNGLLAAVLGGILAGCLDYLFDMLNFPLSIGIMVIVFLVGWRMKKGYYSYHILYPVLSILFLVIGFFFSYFSYYAVYYLVVMKSWGFYALLGSGRFWLNFIIEPFVYLINGFIQLDFLAIALGSINIIIYIWAFFFTYRMVKGRNR